jgi:hypothetical protein
VNENLDDEKKKEKISMFLKSRTIDPFHFGKMLKKEKIDHKITTTSKLKIISKIEKLWNTVRNMED